MDVRIIARQTAIAAAVIAGALGSTGGTAVAAPRRVAVVNLATDAQAGQEVAQQLRGLLQKDPHFAPLPRGPIRRALTRPLEVSSNPSAAVIADVTSILDEVRAARTQFGVDSDQSLRMLQRAERMLETVFPTPEVIAALAEVNFQAGLVLMDRRESVTASDAFRVVRRLEPDRETIDPRQYAPNYVEAYRAAGQPQAETAPAIVRAPYDGATIYIDGQAVGKSPYEARLAPGKHYAWAEFEGYKPAGARFYAVAYNEVAVDLPLRSLPIEDRVLRLRSSLLGSDTASDGAIARVASEISSLTGAPVVVVIGQRGGELAISVYDASVARLGGWQGVDADGLPSAVASLPGRPPPPRRVPLVPDAGSGPSEPVPWYQTTVGVSAISATAVVTVLGIVLLATSSSSDLPPPSVTCCTGSFE